MAMTRTTISFTREGMDLIREAAKRQGSSVSQFVREAALMRATMAAGDNPYPMRALAAQLRAIGRPRVRGGRAGAEGRQERGRSEALMPPELPAERPLTTCDCRERSSSRLWVRTERTSVPGRWATGALGPTPMPPGEARIAGLGERPADALGVGPLPGSAAFRRG